MRQVFRFILLVSLLLFFAGVGIAHIVKPDYFIARSGVRKGGEMLTEWNRLQFQMVGAIFAAASLYGLYKFLSSYFGH